MVKVYLIAQMNTVSRHTIKRSKEEFNLICRRILKGGGIPISPSLWYVDYNKDPRLRKELSWWVNEVYAPLMKDCPVLCYKPNLIGIDPTTVEAEKETWKELNPLGSMVSSDVILDFLLNYHAAKILKGVS